MSSSSTTKGLHRVTCQPHIRPTQYRSLLHIRSAPVLQLQRDTVITWCLIQSPFFDSSLHCRISSSKLRSPCTLSLLLSEPLQSDVATSLRRTRRLFLSHPFCGHSSGSFR